MTPATMRMRPGTIVVACAPGTVQVGADRRWATRLGGLSRGESAWIRYAGSRPGQFGRSAHRFRVTQARATELCDVLATAGHLVPQPAEHAERIPLRRAGGRTDVAALSAIRDDGDGATTLRNRADKRVAITDAGRLGAQIALLLAGAGVGELQIPDERKVTAADLGPYDLSQIDQPRVAALRAKCAALGLRPSFEQAAKPHVIVSIEAAAPAAAYFSKMLQAAVPHLPIALAEAGAELGPFVLPGRTACVHCYHLTIAESDPDWPDYVQNARELDSPPVETVAAGAIASLVAAQVLTFLDGARPTLANATATITLPDLAPDFTQVTPDSACGCAGVPATPPPAAAPAMARHIARS